MKTIGIAGGSGFTGLHISHLLTRHGYRVIIFSRSKRSNEGNIHFAVWQPDKGIIDREALQQVDIMINLAGAGVADKRWTEDYKKEIISSRKDATLFLLGELKKYAPACKTYISAAATGIYGPDRGDNLPFTETAPSYHDFLALVCREWEAAALSAVSHFRTVIFRFGIVLGREGGAYPKLAGPVRLGVMPILGSGKQMVSWIHVDDAAGMVLQAVEDENISGIYNAVSPQPVSHKELMNTIAGIKGGWKIPVPVPAFVLRLIMGESSIEVLKSCTASAGKITAAGYSFRYPSVAAAVQELNA